MQRTDRVLVVCPILAIAAILLVMGMTPQTSPRRRHGGGLDERDGWTVHVQTVDRALNEGDLFAAETAWEEARRGALMTRHWEAMLGLGHAARKIGQRGGFPGTAAARARTAYLAALFRARDQGSVEGTLRAAEAFASLGDWGVASRFVRVAEELADHAQDPQARKHLRAFRDRWGIER
jgi:hypothetical protein